MATWIGKVIDVRPGERTAVVFGGVAFFLVLCSYMVIRPVREAMGVERSFDDLYWLWFGTFLGMIVANALYAFLATRVPVRLLAGISYAALAMMLGGFMLILVRDPGAPTRGFMTLPGWIVGSDAPQPVTIAHVFYIWISVFNLFMVSLFWAQASARFTFEQSKRLFPLIAAGGTVGALSGSLSTRSLADHVTPAMLMGVSLAMLVAAIIANAWAFRPVAGDHAGVTHDGGVRAVPAAPPPPKRVNVRAGLASLASSRYMLGIAGWVTLLAVASSLLYFTQAEVVRERGKDLTERIRLFAEIDVLTQGVTLLLQLTATAGLLRRLGTGRMLLAGPLVLVAGYIALALAPVYATIAVFQACFRAAERGVARPARETLFTVVPPEQKFVTKPVLDTFVYRGGDLLGLLVHRGLHVLAAGLWPVTAVGLSLAGGWGVLGMWLGRRQQRLAEVRATAQASA